MRTTIEKPDQQHTAVRIAVVLVLLYLFLVGVKALETAISCFGEGFAEGLLATVRSPWSGLAAGVLATVLVQSSSVTTATIVGLVGSGALSVEAAIPMVMGANIGTTITNTLASLGHVRRGPEFRRAFAGATVHDMFNLLAVMVILPIELVTGFLERSAHWLTDVLAGSSPQVGVVVEGGGLKTYVKAPVVAIQGVLEGWISPGVLVGLTLLTLGLACIFLALTFITSNMRKLMAGGIERSMNKVLGKGGGIGAMAVGMVLTVMVQSSSITTSVLIPLVAAGVLTLDNAYPVTLGANIGTTVTGLLASMAAARPEALTIALVHTLFNLSGTLIFYPIPAMRRIPIWLATHLAEVASEKKRIVVVWVVGMFVVLPVLLLVLGR